MDTNRLKRFATEARNILMQGVVHRLQALGFDADGKPVEEPQRFEGGATFMGDTVTEDFYDKWQSLRRAIESHKLKEVAEEAAYTWFNRLMAIRIMVKNGLIAPVLQYESEGIYVPLIVTEARQGRLPEMKEEERRKLMTLLDDDSKTAEQFAILIVAFCHATPVINRCFGHISDYTELLLPANILAEGGFVDLINRTDFIAEEDYKSPELIGWLYQFYISEKKDDVFAAFKKGKKAEAEDIPAATQIFTPNWIVKYMVQNTIGRIYLDNNPYEEDIQKNWKYLVEQPEKTPEDKILHYDDLKELKFGDLACGSGHILNEGFDILYDLYILEGYSRREAIENIFRYNLTGIDIDTRAKQLAQFALLLKACQKDNSFADAHIMPRVLDMPNVDRYTWRDLNGHMSCALKMKGADEVAYRELDECFNLMKDAQCLGSIMKMTISASTRVFIQECIVKQNQKPQFEESFTDLFKGFELILALTENYSTLVMNPPYMGNGNMNDTLSSYVKRYYSEGKADLCTAFMLMQSNRTCQDGYYANIVPPSWMFLSTFEGLRYKLVNTQSITSLLHLSRGVFGADFGSVSCVIKNNEIENSKGTYFRLIERTFQEFDQKHLKLLFEKTLAQHDFRFYFSGYNKDVTDILYDENGAQVFYSNVQQDNFKKIPGCPIVYWVSPTIQNIFVENLKLSDFADAKNGMTTGDNNRFLRLWFEVSISKSSFEGVYSPRIKWYPYNKGGYPRHWYGNLESVINWEYNGKELKSYKKSILRNPNFYFKPSISWSLLSSSSIGTCFRYNPKASLFDVNGMSLFTNSGVNSLFIIGLLNSKVAKYLLNLINPTMALQCGDVLNMPFINIQNVDSIKQEECISISKNDWDSHETSWDFEANPLVALCNKYTQGGCGATSYRLENFVKDFEAEWEEKFNQLHQNEEELNRQFIEIYGLQDELTPDVPLDEITILQQGEISIENK